MVFLRAPCFIVHTTTPICDNVITENAITDNAITDNAITDNVITDNVITDNAITDNAIIYNESMNTKSSLVLNKSEEEGEEHSSSDDGFISIKNRNINKKIIFNPQKQEKKDEKRKFKEEAKNLLISSVKREIMANSNITNSNIANSNNFPSDKDWGIGSDSSDDDDDDDSSSSLSDNARKIRISQEDKEWRLRELKRIKRSKEERERSKKEEELLQGERDLSEEEKIERDRQKMMQYMEAKGGEMNFMQRYYHKGSFFIGGDSDNNSNERMNNLMKRDYSSSLTGGDTSTSTIQSLPSLKQVRNWGKRSRSKWTHLVEEDTTSFDYGWGQRRNELNYQLVGRMGGMLPRPSE